MDECEKDLLTALKQVNKIKERDTYFQNTTIKIAPCHSFLIENVKKEFTVESSLINHIIEIYCRFDSIYVPEYKMFIPNEHIKVMSTFHVYKLDFLIPSIKSGLFPFPIDTPVFIYEIESYFKSQHKNFTKIMNNTPVDWQRTIERQDLDNWMVNGIINNYKILLTTKKKLEFTLRQYCKLAPYKPYREILEFGIAMSRCGNTPSEIWYRMVESIPRIRKSEINTFMLEFPHFHLLMEAMLEQEEETPKEGYKVIKSLGKASAIRLYNIIFGIE